MAKLGTIPDQIDAERFAHLFTEQERATARQRLDDFGYGPAAA